MNAVLDPAFLKKLKKLDVRIRKSFKERILIFSKNPLDQLLNNHLLHEPYEGYRSIDATDDYRALYHETIIVGENIAYFVYLGTHEELYGPKPDES